MKLREFNAENMVSQRSVQPAIHMNRKTGVITVNKAACSLIGAKIDSQIVFHQDEEDPGNWYLESVSKNGFPLRGKTGADSNLATNHVTMVRSILESLDIDSQSARFLIAGTPTVQSKRLYWGLIAPAS